MFKQYIKLLLLSSLLLVTNLPASAPHLNEEDQRIVQKITRYENQEKLPFKIAAFLMIALGCDTPIIESLNYCWTVPTAREFNRFIDILKDYHKNNPGLDFSLGPLEEVDYSINAITRAMPPGDALEQTKLCHIGNNMDRTKLSRFGNPFKKIPRILNLCCNLTELNLNSNAIRDLSPLASCTGLQVLLLSGNSVESLLPLVSLKGLQELDLLANKVKDLSPLAALTGLRELNLAGNEVQDLSPLDALTGLQRLNLARNKLEDLSSLELVCTGLQDLCLSNNPIKDVTPLRPIRPQNKSRLINLFDTPAGLEGNLADILDLFPRNFLIMTNSGCFIGTRPVQ